MTVAWPGTPSSGDERRASPVSLQAFPPGIRNGFPVCSSFTCLPGNIAPLSPSSTPLFCLMVRATRARVKVFRRGNAASATSSGQERGIVASRSEAAWRCQVSGPNGVGRGRATREIVAVWKVTAAASPAAQTEDEGKSPTCSRVGGSPGKQLQSCACLLRSRPY